MPSDRKGKSRESVSSSKAESRRERTRTSSAGVSAWQPAPPEATRSPAGPASRQGNPARMPQAPSNHTTVVSRVDADRRSLTSSMESRAGSSPDSGSGQGRNRPSGDIVLGGVNIDRLQLSAPPATQDPPFGYEYQTRACQDAMWMFGGPPKGTFAPLNIGYPEGPSKGKKKRKGKPVPPYSGGESSTKGKKK